eukprot:2693276-Prymnesium_polylepis.2
MIPLTDGSTGFAPNFVSVSAPRPPKLVAMKPGLTGASEIQLDNRSAVLQKKAWAKRPRSTRVRTVQTSIQRTGDNGDALRLKVASQRFGYHVDGCLARAVRIQATAGVV